MSIIHDPALYQLRHALRGHVYDPGEPEYEDARTLFNAMVETRPRHVARVSHPHQVSAALAFARARGLRVAVRGGGHSVAGASLVEDGLVIDVRGLRELVVDPERRVVRVGGGLTWGEVDAATQEHGLATVGGRVSSTGVAGLTLGGGSGWLERKHGLTVDNMLAVELITADGEPIRASADEHPELFWALRGGGGNFGVVTAIELRLHPVGPEVMAGLAVFPRARAAELLRRFRDVMVDAPDELSLAFVFLTRDGATPSGGPPAVAIAGMHAGSLEDAEARARADPRGRAGARRVRAHALRRRSSPRSTTRPATATGGPPSTSTTSRDGRHRRDLRAGRGPAGRARADLHPRLGRRGRARARGRPADRPRRALRRAPAAAVGGPRRRRARRSPTGAAGARCSAPTAPAPPTSTSPATRATTACARPTARTTSASRA